MGILKIGLERIQNSDPSLTLEEAIQKTCVAENHCLLMDSGVSPAQLVFGESDYFSTIEQGIMKHLAILDSDGDKRQKHLVGT